jgi:PKHD-type hydroxylase
MTKAMAEALSDRALFEDGARTAGRSARLVKRNLQAIPSIPRVAGLAEKIEEALKKSNVFNAAAWPCRFIRTGFSRCEVGMGYGRHIDDPIIHGARSDLSFTVFLSDPQDYEGGELVVDSSDGETEVKLPAGHAVLYPATAIHWVNEVRAGIRLVAFGWVQSRIRSAEQREILFDLERVQRQLFERDGKTDLYDTLARAKANLVRQWAAN